MPFVKLDTGILESTLWIDRSARDVFITALLMAEPREITHPTPQLKVRNLEETGFLVEPGWYGFVAAAGVGIIRRSLVDTEEGYKALEVLGAPEPESRSQDFSGRRMVRVDGGYIILNYFKYRDRDYSNAERQSRWRERQKSKHNGVTVTRVTQAEAEAEADKNNLLSVPKTEPTGNLFPDLKPVQLSPKKDPRAEQKLLNDSFAAIWGLYPKKQGGKSHTRKKYESAVRATMNGDMRHQCELIYCRAKTQIEIWEDEGKEKQFIPLLSTWLNQRRFDEEPEPSIDEPKKVRVYR